MVKIAEGSKVEGATGNSLNPTTLASEPFFDTTLPSAHPQTHLCGQILNMVLRILLPRQAIRQWPTLHASRSFSSSAARREPGISDTIDDMVGKLKQAVKDSSSHAEQFEGVQEEGLRMLVFGKPGSGKVSSSV